MAAWPRVTRVEWFFLVVALVASQRYAWLLDDAFIYFRYVDNCLFLKLGWVFNRGEYVEGYSSPLWLLVLTALRATHLNFWWITRLLGVLSVVAVWFLATRVNRKLSPRPTLHLPLVLLLTNYAVLSYCTSGVETPLVQVSGVLFAYYFAGGDSKTVKTLLALTPLVRHELALPLALALAFEWRTKRSLPWAWTLLAILFSGAWVVFRVYTYADFLPSTFYAKDTLEIRQGLRYLHDTLWPYWGYMIGPIVAFAALDLWCRDAGPKLFGRRVAMVVTSLSVVVYVVKIGGDPRHYRYLAFSYPLLVCAGAGALESWWLRRGRSERVITVAGFVLALLTFCAYPRQLTAHPLWMHERHRLVAEIADASVHRHEPDYRYENWGPRTTPAELRRLLASDGTLTYKNIFADYRCEAGYLRMGERMIHNLGLTDPVLARTEMPANRPAHKLGLMGLAEDLVAIEKQADTIGPGMFRTAVAAGRAPPWIVNNLTALEAIERKVFNRHDLAENFRLASEHPHIEPRE
ncbi:MAG: hypothetical protein K8S98_03380 [Planctomycetes bacterium]|nr:hypothetical protein [Planctomycetota bacterium]